MKSFQQFISESITINGDFNGTLNVGSSQPEQAKVSDTYTLAARVLSGTGDIIGALSFFDLT